MYIFPIFYLFLTIRPCSFSITILSSFLTLCIFSIILCFPKLFPFPNYAFILTHFRTLISLFFTLKNVINTDSINITFLSSFIQILLNFIFLLQQIHIQLMKITLEQKLSKYQNLSEPSQDSFDVEQFMKKRNKGIKKKKKKLIHNVCVLEKGKNGNNTIIIKQFVQNSHIVHPETLQKKLKENSERFDEEVKKELFYDKKSQKQRRNEEIETNLVQESQNKIVNNIGSLPSFPPIVFGMQTPYMLVRF